MSKLFSAALAALSTMWFLALPANALTVTNCFDGLSTNTTIADGSSLTLDFTDANNCVAGGWNVLFTVGPLTDPVELTFTAGAYDGTDFIGSQVIEAVLSLTNDITFFVDDDVLAGFGAEIAFGLQATGGIINTTYLYGDFFPDSSASGFAAFSDQSFGTSFLVDRDTGGPGDNDGPDVSEVPLPAAGFLLIGGIGALGLMRRRKSA